MVLEGLTICLQLRKRAWSESLPAKTRIRFDSERGARDSSSEDSVRTSTTELGRFSYK